MSFRKGNSLEDWNPMEDDFNSVAFNSYDRGHGTAIPTDRLPSWQKRVSHATKQTFTLHVSNIPEGLKESGLSNIFSKYGEVLRIYRSQAKSNFGRCFGFIDYATLKEAELAIREVDAKPPLRLRVSFSMTKQDKQNQNKLKAEEMTEYINMNVQTNKSSWKRLESDDGGSVCSGSQSNVAVYQRSHLVKGVGRGSPMKPPYDCGLRDLSNSQLQKFLVTTTNKGREITYIEGDEKQHCSGHCVQHCNSTFSLPSYCDQGIVNRKTSVLSCDGDHNALLRSETIHTSHSEVEISQSIKPLLHRPHTSPLQGSSFFKRPVNPVNVLPVRGSKQEILPMPCIDLPNGDLPHIPRPVFNCGGGLLPTPPPQYRIANTASHGRGIQHPEQQTYLTSHFRANSSAESDRFTLRRHLGERLKEVQEKNDGMAKKAAGGPCENCHIFGISCCSACKAWYCSRDCQVKHWPVHRQHCSKTSSSRDNAISTNKDQLSSRQKEQGKGIGGKCIVKDKGNKEKQQNMQDSWKNQPKPKGQETKPQTISSRKTGNEGNRQQKLSEGTLDSKEKRDSQKSSQSHQKENRPTLRKQRNGAKQTDVSWKDSSDAPIKKHTKLKYESLGPDLSEVVVCSGFSPDEIWLHKVPEAETNIQNLSKIMQKCCEKGSIYHPKVGEICGALYLLDNTWCRVKIEEVQRNECIAHYVDFGNKESVPVSRIRRLSDECLSLPAQAIVCKLAFIQPSEVTWGKDAVKLLSLSVTNSPLKARAVTKLDNFKYEIELIDAEGNQINEKLVKSGCAKNTNTLPVTKLWHVSTNVAEEVKPLTPIPTRNLAEPVISIPTLLSSLHAGEELSLVIVFIAEDKTDFCANLLTSQSKTILEKLQQLNDLQGGKNLEQFRPKVGDIVAAQSVSDGNWYRASVVCVETNSYNVLYVDFGNKECVTTVVPLPLEFRTIASACVHCLVRESLSSENKLLVDKHIVEGEFLSAKVTFACESTVCMDVRTTDSVICSVTGYSWDYVLTRVEPSTVNSVQFSMPFKGDVEDSKLSSSLPSLISSLHVGEVISLVIIFVTKNTDFWAHPLVDEIDENIEKLVQLNELQNTKSNEEFSTKVGDLVAAQSPTDKNWYRASILRVDANSHYVCYIDYGNEESVTTIAPLPSAFKSVSSVAIHCCVCGDVSSVNRLLLNENVIEGGCLSVKVTSKNNNMVYMDLLSPKDEKIVLCSLVGYSWDYSREPNTAISIPSIVPISKEFAERNKVTACDIPLSIAKLQQGSKVHLEVVHMVNHKKDFWAHPLMEETPAITSKLKELNELGGNTAEVFSPNQGDIVVAQSIDDNIWYRAYLLHAKDNSYTVRYIDYGNEENVTKVIPLPSEFMAIPSLAMHCVLDGTLPSTSEHILEELLNAGLVPVKITSTQKDKMNMALMSLEDNSVIGSLVAYPWYHNLPTLHASEKMNQEKVGPLSMQPTTKDSDLSTGNDNIATVEISERNENSKNTNVSSRSVLSSLRKDTDIKLNVVFIVEDTTDFWAHILTTETREMMEQLVKMNELKSDEKDTFCPNAGDIVAALSVVDGLWYRACILQAKEKYYIQYIDYGNEEQVQKVVSLLPEYASVPPLAVHCILKEALPLASQQAFKRLVCLNNTISGRIMSVTNDTIEINLMNPDDSTVLCAVTGCPWNYNVQKLTSEMPELILDANTSQELLCQSQPASLTTDTKSRTDEKSSELFVMSTTSSVIRRLPDNSEISLGIVYALENDFWAQPLTDGVGEMMQHLTTLDKCASKGDKEFSPKLHEVVVALSIADGCWYRACVLKIRNKKYHVRYIDYGNEEEVEKVVPLPPDYASVPSLTVHCTIQEPLSPDAKQIFGKLVCVDSIVSVRITSRGEESIKLDLLNPTDNNVVCTLFGYPWHYDILFETSKLNAVSNETGEQAVIERSSKPSCCIVESLNGNIDTAGKPKDGRNPEKKSALVCITPTLIATLKQDSEITLGIIFTCDERKDFWAYPFISETSDIVLQLEKLNGYSDNVKEENFCPAVGDLIAAFSGAYSCWYRACVLQKKNGNYHVRYIDYGNEEDIQKVIPLPVEYTKLPSLIIHCVLHETISSAAEQLKKLICSESIITVRIKAIEKNEVKMDLLSPADSSVICALVGYPWYHDIQTGVVSETLESIAEQPVTLESHISPPSNFKDATKTVEQPLTSASHVNSLCHDGDITNIDNIEDTVEVATSLQNQERLNVPSVLHSLQPDTYTNILVLKPDEKSFSALAGEEKALKAVIEIESNMAEKYDFKCKKRSFSSGDIVAAYSPSELCWRRAYILKSLDSSHLVHYVDYGEEESVMVACPLEEQHCFMPSPVIFCTLDEVSDNALKHLKKEIISNAVLDVKIIGHIEDKLQLQFKIPGEEITCHLIAHPWNYQLNENTSLEKGSMLSESCRDIQQDDNHISDSYNHYSTKPSNKEEPESHLEPGSEKEPFSIPNEQVETAKHTEQDRYINVENSCKDLRSCTNVIGSVISNLKPDREVVFRVLLPSDEKMKFWACICDDELGKSITEVLASVENSEVDETIRPKAGDIIIAKSPLYGEWYRAYVLKDNGQDLQVRYVDFGNEESVTTYRALNSVHLDLLSPAVFCIVEDGSTLEIDELFTVGNKFQAKVNAANISKVQLSVISNGATLCNLLGLPWYYDLHLVDESYKTDVPKNIDSYTMYNDIKTLPVTSLDNINVQIVHVINFQNLYVQCVSQLPEIAKVMHDVTEYCENAPMMPYHPRINEMVCAKYIGDEMWYRGFVKSVNATGSFVVHFIDFGIEEDVDASFLRPLPKYFSTFPAYAFHISLQLPSILPTMKILEILHNQVWKATVINAETACLRLFNDKGLSVTEVLKAELALDDQRNNNNNTETQSPVDKILTQKKSKKYYYSDCQAVALPIGEVTVVVKSVIAPDTIFCCLADEEIISALENLNNRITVHCTDTKPSGDFCPDIGEICLAKYSDDGLWYRAVPLHYVGKSIQMLFVDFGNIEEVNPVDTRPVIPEFMELPLQGIHCALVGFYSAVTEWNMDEIKILLSLVPQQKPLTINVIEEKELDVYIIDIPGVSDDLKRRHQQRNKGVTLTD